MKVQDIVFLLIFALLFLFKRPRIFVFAGLASWFLAIPLFAKWVFFTAERLTWYGAACMVAFLLISLARPNTVK